MDKISGILPANARTKSTDTSQSQPMRPGAPSMGRPVGRVTKAMGPAETEDNDSSSASEVQDKISLGKADQSFKSTYKPNPEAARVKMVEELSAKFNISNPKNLAKESDMSISEEVTENVRDLRS